jgi:hypothetical protein
MSNTAVFLNGGAVLSSESREMVSQLVAEVRLAAESGQLELALLLVSAAAAVLGDAEALRAAMRELAF